MDNSSRQSEEKNLSVSLEEELLGRITRVANALKISKTQFVKEALDERTREHKPDADGIAEHERRIVERERLRKARSERAL